jgi:hypothetical protein
MDGNATVLDYELFGAEGDWPSGRWLEFVEGPSSGPSWGAWVGYSDGQARLYVCTYPRLRFDEAMKSHDGFREIAFATAHAQVNLVLAGISAHDDRKRPLERLLSSRIETLANRCEQWQRIEMQVTLEDHSVAAREGYLIGLGGWQSAFCLNDTAYIVVHAWHTNVKDAVLARVAEPERRGPAGVPDLAGSISSDLLWLLADDNV